MAISIEQWQDQLPNSMFKFAKLKLKAGDTDFEAGLLAAAVLWPIRQALRDGDDQAIRAAGQIVGLNQVGLVQQAVKGWADDRLEAARSLSARAADDARLDDALTALTEYFDAAALFAEQLAQAASHMSPAEEPPERYTPHPAEFQALVAAVMAGGALESVRLPLDEIDEEDELAARVKRLIYRVIKTYIDQVRTSADGPQPADDPVLRRLESEFAESAYALRCCETDNDMLATLMASLAHLPELVPLTEVLSQSLTPPYLVLRHPPTDLPHPALRHTFSGHKNAVEGCAITPDGATVVSASHDGTLKVWDAASGAERLTLTGHSDSVYDCAISADGSIIVSASGDKTLRVWDARTGAELMTLAGHADRVRSCDISADGSVLVSTSDDNTLKVWDAASGAERLTLTGHSGAVNDCAISADGSVLVSTSDDNTLKVWDARTGAERLTLTGHSDSVYDCAISADGSTIVSVSRDCTLKVWDGRTGAERLTIQHPWTPDDCAISADGSTIVSASCDDIATLMSPPGYYNLLEIWDGRTGAKRLTLTGHTSLINSCAISADGRHVVSAAGETIEIFDHTVRVWDLHEDARPPLPPRLTAPAFNCDISADGAVATFSSKGGPTEEGGLSVWDPQHMAERYTLRGAWTSALSADGTTIVATAEDRTLKVWDARGGTQRATLAGQSDSIVECAISADGGTMISRDWNETLKIWDITSGVERFTLSGHDSWLRCCAISADGAVAISASQDGEIKVWDTHTGAERLTIATESGLPGDCAVSPDGALICATSTYFDRDAPKSTFKVWDAHTGAERFSLTRHEWLISACVFSHDGGLIVSAAMEGILKVWDAGSGACLTTMGGLGPLRDCACSSYGEHIVAAGSYGINFLQLVR